MLWWNVLSGRWIRLIPALWWPMPRYFVSINSMKVNKYKKYPIDSIRKIPIDTTLRVWIIGIQGKISKDNKGKIIVMDNNQSIWAICNNEIKNIQRFEKKNHCVKDYIPNEGRAC